MCMDAFTVDTITKCFDIFSLIWHTLLVIAMILDTVIFRIKLCFVLKKGYILFY